MQIHRVATRVAVCCGVAFLVGCGKSDGVSDSDAKKAADSAAAANSAGAMTATPMASASLALSDLAGKWMVRATPQGGTDTTTTHVLGGTYRPLNADGTLGAAITRIALRNGEGAILVKV